jgi:hypothetical protein
VRSARAERLPRLLVCEGAEDKLFFERLITVRQLPWFYIADAKGNGEFAAAIRAFQVSRTADYNSLREILIVADNDDCPRDRFANVRTQIDRVFGTGTAPDAPLQKTPRTATRAAAITVLMIPWANEQGHLERMCVEAARDADKNIAAHVDTFMDLIRAESWRNESRFGKAWLRTNLAARCSRDPFIALGRVFTEARYNGLIPVDHSSFDRIAEVLSGL